MIKSKKNEQWHEHVIHVISNQYQKISTLTRSSFSLLILIRLELFHDSDFHNQINDQVPTYLRSKILSTELF